MVNTSPPTTHSHLYISTHIRSFSK